MPHITLEYSSNVREKFDSRSVLNRLITALSESGPYAMEDTKARITSYDRFQVAEGDADRAFVHLTLRILEGRTQEMIESAATALRSVLEEVFKASKESMRLSLTIEVIEMPKRLYFK